MLDNFQTESKWYDNSVFIHPFSFHQEIVSFKCFHMVAYDQYLLCKCSCSPSTNKSSRCCAIYLILMCVQSFSFTSPQNDMSSPCSIHYYTVYIH